MKHIFYFILILVVVMLIGFLGYYFGFLGFIYNVMMPEAFGNFPLMTLSVIFGAAAFFSPCSFTVLPAYVSHYLAGDSQRPTQQDFSRGKSLAKGLYFGFIAALGVITVNVIIGLVIEFLGSAAPFAKDPREDIPLILAVRTLAGILIAYFGLLTVLGKPIQIPLIERVLAQRSFDKSIFVYGILYNGAAVGCTGPILLGLTLYALTSGSFNSAFTAFLIFSLTMGILMVLLTTLIALFKDTILKNIMPFTPVMRRIAGFVMIFAGITISFLTLEGNRLFVKLFFPFLK